MSDNKTYLFSVGYTALIAIAFLLWVGIQSGFVGAFIALIAAAAAAIVYSLVKSFATKQGEGWLLYAQAGFDSIVTYLLIAAPVVTWLRGWFGF